MESPVRICLGAALVVNLLLLSSTTVNGNAIDDASTTTTRDARPTPRYTKLNSTTWVARNRPKTPDVALNELNSKDLVSEEHTEQNSKYQGRGRVRFGQHRSSTEGPKKRANITKTSTVPTKDDIMIVTPTPPKKNVSQIIDSMRNYKKTTFSSSTTPVSKQNDDSNESGDSDENDDFPQYSPPKHDDNFFTIPSFNDDSVEDSETENTDDKEYRVTPLQSFSRFFPRASQASKEKPTRSSFFHDFDVDLTTPKNDYFDKRFRQISSSIMKNLAAIKATTPTTSDPNVKKRIKEISNVKNDVPTNKSSVYIKNTKEVRVSDNDEAGSSKKELSDVQGTSVYYEMSILSTETYTIDSSNDDDCDDEPNGESSTTTAVNEDVGTIKATSPTFTSTPSFTTTPTKPSYSEKYEPVSTVIAPVSSSATSFKSSSQNSILSTEKTSTRYYTGTYSRNTYSKRLNFTGSKEANSVTPRADQEGSNQVLRPTRRFYSTTPKTKLWLAPRRNITRGFSRSTVPTTIYSEHFDIKNATISRPRMPNRQMLTTVSSDIDPVLQSEISGAKKIVQSQSLSDNSIPTLWKRGSTKFTASSTASSTEVSGSGDMEIPPTLTAWALASLRSPPSLASSVNRNASGHKSDDENELQKVGEVTESKQTTTTTPAATTTATNDFTPKTYSEFQHNQFPWRQVYIPPTTTSSEDITEQKTTESKSESLPAESSNVSVQSSAQPATTEAVKTFEFEFVTEARTTEKNEISAAEVIGITSSPKNLQLTTVNTVLEQLKDSENDALPPVNSSPGTKFESITKFPAGVTTPEGDIRVKSEKPEVNTAPSTTDYDITTIRFSYVPTEESTEIIKEQTTTPDSWHPVIPTRTKPTTLEDAPITTYRPQYVSTTDIGDETTTDIQTVDGQTTDIQTTPEMIDISSKLSEGVTESRPTEVMTIEPEITTYRGAQEPTTVESSTKIVVDVVTEINTEKETPQNDMTSKTPEQTDITTGLPSYIKSNESMSEENSGSNEVITIETTKLTTKTVTTPVMTTKYDTPEAVTTEFVDITTQKDVKEEVTSEESSQSNEINADKDEPVETTTDAVTKSVNDLEDYPGEVTTEASSRVLTTEEAGSGAAVAIAVSTIGVIALILLVGLLLVVRRRGRRGVYAQRCTPVSLDAYSLDSVSVGHRKGNQRLRASKRSYGNPAYDDEVTSHPMQYAALANFAMDMESMSTEFSEIPSVTVRPDEVPPGCEDKNRYSNVLPLPETRVPLMRLGSDPTSEYINANYVTGPGNIKNYYIACQAPLQHTVEDVWRMVWEQNSRLIVMLTEYMENGVEKCYEYLPPSEVSDNRRTFGDFQIILKKREQRDKYAVSTAQLINLRTRTWREITHMWYFWPAKGVPDDFDSIIDFLSEMRGFMKMSQTAKEYDEDGIEVIYGDQSRASFNNLSKFRDDGTNGHGVNVYSPAKAEELMRRSHANNGTLGRMKAASEIEGVRPCVVICASGAGRSAALIALDICARALAAGAVDVPRVVRELRAQRPHSLANRHHYIFLYKVLSEYGNKLMGGGVDTI